tara:strand:+ start:124 stop:393 length:270 start_codon:yes stop_codon:yes gene_type:complete
MCLNFNKLNIKLFLVLLAFLFMIFNVKIALSQDNMPDFPYDPEVQASKAKVCAKVCLRRRDACIKIEANNPDSEQICQGQMFVCVNQCR